MKVHIKRNEKQVNKSMQGPLAASRTKLGSDKIHVKNNIQNLSQASQSRLYRTIKRLFFPSHMYRGIGKVNMKRGRYFPTFKSVKDKHCVPPAPRHLALETFLVETLPVCSEHLLQAHWLVSSFKSYKI